MTEISGIDEQISKDEWPKFMVIDARDPAQFAKGHIPGAINMDWRQVLVKRSTIPKKNRYSFTATRAPCLLKLDLHCA
jgi:rhodanese-related sulfurtransferase